MGLAQVLSQTQRAPADREMDAISAMSVILSRGLDGVSTQIMRVLGWTARRTLSASVMSTKVVWRPHGAKTSRSRRAVPW